MHCPEAFESSSSLKYIGKRGEKKTTPTTLSKSFHLKCSWKCLIQPCMHLDSSFIHLCIFSERQTAESSWYQIHVWVSPCPCLREREDREVEQSLMRQTSASSSLYSGVCVFCCPEAFCLLKKTFNSAFISPSMMHTDILEHQDTETSFKI